MNTNFNTFSKNIIVRLSLNFVNFQLRVTPDKKLSRWRLVSMNTIDCIFKINFVFTAFNDIKIFEKQLLSNIKFYMKLCKVHYRSEIEKEFIIWQIKIKWFLQRPPASVSNISSRQPRSMQKYSNVSS